MPQRDYILRMIEQAGILIAELRRRILRGERSGVEGELRAMATQAGFDLSLADMLEPDAILQLLGPAGDPDATRVWLVAELVYLEALTDWHAGNSGSARDRLAKARRLFGALDLGALMPSLVAEAGDRIREIDEMLASPASAAE
jgi:hypothetical protein